MSFCLSLNNPKHIKHVLCLCFVLPQPGKIRTRTKNHFTDPARTVLSYSSFSFRRQQRCERIVLSFVRSCAVFTFASVLDYCSTSWIHVRRCEHFSCGLDHDTVDNPRQPGGGPSLYRVYPCGKLPVGQVFSKPELHIISFKAAIPCMDNSFNRLVTNHPTGWQNLPQFTRCRKVSHCSCCFRVSKGSGSESRPQVPRTESRRACWIFDTEIWPQKPIFSNVFECCFCFEFCLNFSGIPS